MRGERRGVLVIAQNVKVAEDIVEVSRKQKLGKAGIEDVLIYAQDCHYPEGDRSSKLSTDEIAESLKALKAGMQVMTASTRPRANLEERPSVGVRASADSPGQSGIPSPVAEPSNQKLRNNNNSNRETEDQAPFSGLLPLPVLLETIDIYFECCHNQPYGFFHEGNFRESLWKGQIPNHLLFAVLASAMRFSKNPFFDNLHNAAVLYANKSWKMVVSTCFSNNQTADLPGKNRHCFAWIKIGLAVRFAQDMKFMLESAHDLPFAVQEERRRVFWSVYLLDRLVSCGRARPPAILDASCQLQLPSDEDTWRSGAWKEVLTLQQLSYRELSTPEQLGPFSHVVAMAYTLGRAAQYMLQQFNTRSQDPPWGANSDFVAIQSDLVYLETVLQMSKSPTDLVAEHTSPGGRHIDQHAIGPAIFSRALFHLTYCLLHHPFLLRKRLESCQIAAPSTFLTRAFETAWEHSRRMTKLLQEAQEAGAMLRASFYGYCMVVAGSIAALHLHDVSDAKRAESADLVRANTSIIEKIGRHWRNVSLMAISFRNFVEDTSRFAHLASDAVNVAVLSPEDCEAMWAMVDYSTMSDVSARAQTQLSPAAEFWMDGSMSWQDLFGRFDTMNQGAQQQITGPDTNQRGVLFPEVENYLGQNMFT
ncbi:hypothetical protein H2204_003120 [Knufia peltigerae]|uniref:Xylanolytic transcriptional activator regulatory domain-containing protein n=1 Tax=Knufia peltigerae TaxID=1002370 RepID=A0AA38YBH5_9EURO|nr:hypothetical protein H2204_003120 [Knufia peltigerae]